MTAIAISTTTAIDGEYAAAIRDAGAEPVLLDLADADVARQLTGIDGVVVSGGGDVDPALYGGESMLADGVDRRRDDFEIALLRLARERHMPTLCICRGLQIANVAFGGTLVPDIASAFGPHVAVVHQFKIDGSTERGLIPGHEIAIAADSNLARIAGTARAATGSRHHQSLAEIAPDLRVVATTSDGIVEAAEARFDSPFWLGVQWHPESTLTLDGGTSRAIFAALVHAATVDRARTRVG